MSSAVAVNGLVKRFDRRDQRFTALDDVSFELADGELLVLLGPSGCGKSTTLRSIAGLESPDEGSVTLGSSRVFDAAAGIDTPGERRGIGMVFQSFALWPHMTVREIVSFPLRSARVAKEERAARCDEALRVVGCLELANRYPGELSGGQQQRIALARALAAEPRVLLFDEPLSNLDTALRADLRNEIDRAHHRLGFSGVYVTHDQVEALAVADRIAVMNRGRIVQLDKPRTVYQRPANEWVAGFMGYTNRIVADASTAGVVNGPLTGSCAFRFRPEAVQLRPEAKADRGDGLLVSGDVKAAVYLGSATQYEIAVSGTTILADVPTATEHAPIPPGTRVDVLVRREDVLGYADGE